MGPLLSVVFALGCSSNAESPPSVERPTPDVRVTLEEVASGLTRPLYVDAPPGDDRLFIVEQTGTIRILKEGTLLDAPFLDVSEAITRGHNEQGLLGLAFHPSYAENGRFFINYTRSEDGATVVAAYTASEDADRADGASGQVLLVMEQPFGNHNGGHLAFGPDGFLTIAQGDGGSGGDPHGHGQNPATLLGTLLRIDVDGGDPYQVPETNPFVGQEGRADEIWAWGLRNPWRFSFDRETGDLYIADVGQNQWEEVNVQPAASTGGENYGWAVLEGSHCYQAATCDREGRVDPVYEYEHPAGCSITGGYVYRGEAIPDLQGHYLFGDFCENWVWSFRWADGEAQDPLDWTPLLDPDGDRLQGISSFGEDAAGEVYVTSLHSGRVHKIVPAPE